MSATGAPSALLRLDRLSALVDRGVRVLAATLLLGIILSSILQVTSRYLIPVPLPWTEELARYCFIWMTLLGATCLSRTGSHAALDFLAGRLSDTAARRYTLVLELVVVVVAAVLLVSSVGLIDVVSAERSPALGVPMWSIYGGVAAMSAITILHGAARAGALASGDAVHVPTSAHDEEF